MADSNYDNNISLKAYFKDVRKCTVLDGKTQTKLAVKARGGDAKALEELVESNLKFVVSIARDYLYTKLSLQDLIQEGNIGLIKAVYKYDENRGVKFISYAVWWIRQSILAFVYENGNSVRIPINRKNIINKVRKSVDTLSKDISRMPSVEEIAEHTGLSVKDVCGAFCDSEEAISLNSFVASESNTELGETLEGSGFEDIEEGIISKSLKDELESVISELDSRDSDILKMYFGIDDQEPMTLAEIGVKSGLTNERVRQIKKMAIKKLRTFKNSSRLREYIN